MAYRSSSIVTLGTAASVAPAVPTGAASGDIVTVVIYIESSSPTITPPSGFTLKYGPDAAPTNDFFIWTYWKRLTGSDTGTYSFSWTGSKSRQAIAYCHSGRLASGDPFGANRDIKTATATTSLPTCSATAESNDDAIYFAGSFSSGTFTAPSTFTKVQGANEVGGAIKDNVSGTVTASGGTFSVADDVLATLMFLQPAASGGTTVAAPLGTLSLTGLVPTVAATANQSVSVPLGSLTLTGLAPSVLTPVTVAAPLATLSLSGLTPTVAITANQFVAAPLGTLSLTGLVPTVTATANQNIAVPAGSLSLTGLVPTIQLAGNQTIAAPVGSLSLTGLVPTVSASASVTVAAPLGTLTLTGLAPSILTPVSVNMPLGQLVLNGLVPTIGLTQDVLISVPLGQLSLSGPVPTIIGQSLEVPLTELPAGRRRLVRTIYRITIDGQSFECNSLQEAFDLLAKAKEIAVQKAPEIVKPGVPPPLPVITSNTRELRPAITETKREIAKVYRQALIDAEIRMLLELDDRSKHNDDIISFLM